MEDRGDGGRVVRRRDHHRRVDSDRAEPGRRVSLRRAWCRLRSHRAVRRALGGRAGAAVLAALVAVAAHRHWEEAERVRRVWGATTHVVVSTRTLAVGDPVAAGTVEVRTVPVALAPAEPLRTVGPGRRAARTIEAGRILVPADVGDGTAGPTAARLEPGRAGVVVPVGTGAVAVAVGDRVDVVRRGSGGGDVVSADARVLAVTDAAVTLSVDGSSSATLAGLALDEPLGLVVRDPGAGP